MSSEAVIVFLRAPEKGRVKTRLSKSGNKTFVLKLYKGFVQDTLDALEKDQDKFLYFWPPEKEDMVKNWLGNDYTYSAQKGGGLGQRMANAFCDVFKKGYAKVILIGTDIPEICEDIITSAYEILQTKGAVIGPSRDGGYYLIGFQKQRFSKIIFNEIDWSTDTVLDQTLLAMKEMSIQYKMLPTLKDIDTPEDLLYLVDKEKKGTTKTGKRTLKILKDYEG